MGMWESIKGLAGEIAKASFGDVHIGKALTEISGEAGGLAGQAVRKSVAGDLNAILAADIKAKGLKGDALKDATTKLSNNMKSFITTGMGTGQEDIGTLLSGVDENNKHVKKLLDTFRKENGVLDRYKIFEGQIGQTPDVIEFAGKQYNDAAAMFFDREGKSGVGLGKTVGAYFSDPNFGDVRKKAVAAGVVGAGVGMRYLQGGTLTQRPNGENDIAGIPFV